MADTVRSGVPNNKKHRVPVFKARSAEGSCNGSDPARAAPDEYGTYFDRGLTATGLGRADTATTQPPR
jgi:hypothetical protein